MKYLTTIAVLFLAINSAFCQQQNKPQTPTVTAFDYNFEFYPAPVYNRIAKHLTTDTLTKLPKYVSDTSGIRLAVSVRKQGDRITIASLTNQTENQYSEKIKFKGVTAALDLIYVADTDDNESVVVNPARGYVIIIFTKTTGQTKTRQVYHYFGDAPFEKYSPD